MANKLKINKMVNTVIGVTQYSYLFKKAWLLHAELMQYLKCPGLECWVHLYSLDTFACLLRCIYTRLQPTLYHEWGWTQYLLHQMPILCQSSRDNKLVSFVGECVSCLYDNTDVNMNVEECTFTICYSETPQKGPPLLQSFCGHYWGVVTPNRFYLVKNKRL